MSAVHDGGPAFPHHEVWDNDKPEIGWIGGGMSLRDYFAAAPMSDVELETLREAFSQRFPTAPLSIAKLRYWRADTMLEARQQWYSENQAPTPVQEPVVIPPQPGEEET